MNIGNSGARGPGRRSRERGRVTLGCERLQQRAGRGQVAEAAGALPALPSPPSPAADRAGALLAAAAPLTMFMFVSGSTFLLPAANAPEPPMLCSRKAASTRPRILILREGAETRRPSRTRRYNSCERARARFLCHPSVTGAGAAARPGRAGRAPRVAARRERRGRRCRAGPGSAHTARPYRRCRRGAALAARPGVIQRFCSNAV